MNIFHFFGFKLSPHQVFLRWKRLPQRVSHVPEACPRCNSREANCLETLRKGISASETGNLDSPSMETATSPLSVLNPQSPKVLLEVAEGISCSLLRSITTRRNQDSDFFFKKSFQLTLKGQSLVSHQVCSPI